MGLLKLALRNHYKKLRESELGRELTSAFESTGLNDGSEEHLTRAGELFEDFYLTIGAARFVPDEAKEDFAHYTARNPYPILFNAALDHARTCYEPDQLLEYYKLNKPHVRDYSAYVDALFPDFLESRPRSARSIDDLHIYSAQMYVLVSSLEQYLLSKRSQPQSH